MTQELERRVSDALHSTPLPHAPENLRVVLERLPSMTAASRTRTTGPWPWLLAGAATVALALMIAVLQGNLAGPAAAPSTSPSPSPSASASAGPGLSGVIAWTDATPTPEPSVTPATVPPGTRDCGPSDVRATAGWQGATGQMVGDIVVTNVTATACAIGGPPRQVQLRAGGTILQTTFLPSPGSDPGAPVSTPSPPAYLEPGGQASSFIDWSNWCATSHAGVTAVLVTLPGGGRPIVAGPSEQAPGFVESPRCDMPSQRSSLSAWAFQAVAAPQPASEPLPAAVVLSAPVTATAGDTIMFTVDLTNRGATPASLTTCPSYTEDLIVAGRALKPPAARTYLLNCDAIGARIAPGASIALAMRYPIPPDTQPGPVVLAWSLDPGGPFEPTSASANAPLTIVPPAGSGSP